MKKQNKDIQFHKFVYSLIIVLFHFASNTSISCQGGYYAVEYYLLAAGVFLFLAFQREETSRQLATPAQYLKKRFSRFFPWSLTAFLLTAFVVRFVNEPITSVAEWLKCFASDVWEIMMVKWNGINDNMQLVNSPAWTLSALLIVGTLIWTLMYYYKNHFLHLIMPLSLILGFGYWMQIPNANVELWIGFTTFGTFRTWLVMCLSYYCIPLSQWLAGIPFNRKGKCLLTVLEILLHLFSVVEIFLTAQRYSQWLVMLAFMMSISIALSGHSYLELLFNKSKFVDFLGELSMSIYLVHKVVIVMFKSVTDISEWSFIQAFPMLITVFILATLHLNLTKLGCVAMRYVKRKTKEWILN